MDEEVSLFGLIQVVRRQWLLIVGTPALFTVGVLAYHILVGSRLFEATVTLKVIPSSFQSELSPKILSIYGYQRLLESDAVVNETEHRLREREIIGPEDVLRVGRDLRSRIYMARRQETASLTDLVEVTGIAETAKKAAELANTWAETLIEVIGELAATSTSSAVSFLEQQYPDADNLLHELEEELLALRIEYREKHDKTARSWDSRIARHKDDALDSLAQYQIATRAQMEELIERTLSEIKPATASIEESRTWQRVEELVRQLGSVRAELAQVSPVVDLQRSISDDALRLTSLTAGHDPPGETSPSLEPFLDQEINALYGVLAERASAVETELRSVPTQFLGPAILVSTELEEFTRMRAAGLSALKNELELETRNLERQREAELAAIAWERQTRLTIARDDVALQRGLTDKLAPIFNEARLEKAQAGNQVIYPVGGFVDEGKSQYVSLLPRLYLAVLGGLILGLVLAAAVDLSQRAGRPNQV